jgi:hypothetical protein
VLSAVATVITLSASKVRRRRFRIALLKCDIEGAEELFLSTYPDLLSRVDTAVVELHHQFCSPVRCRELLAQAGLKRVRVIKTYGDDCTLEWFSRTHP